MTTEIPTVIVGTRFIRGEAGDQAQRSIAEMVCGSEVRLVREPQNPHDAAAIRCYHLGVWIGFIPRQTNKRIAAAMDGGISVRATVSDPGLFVPGARYKNREPKIVVAWEEQP